MKGATNNARVYVALLGEGTNVWRPVDATKIRDDIFRIDGAAPNDEEWQFAQGAMVRCVRRNHSGDQSELVAVEALDKAAICSRT